VPLRNLDRSQQTLVWWHSTPQLLLPTIDRPAVRLNSCYLSKSHQTSNPELDGVARRWLRAPLGHRPISWNYVRFRNEQVSRQLPFDGFLRVGVVSRADLQTLLRSRPGLIVCPSAILSPGIMRELAERLAASFQTGLEIGIEMGPS
jgi:hypothetical protein